MSYLPYIGHQEAQVVDVAPLPRRVAVVLEAVVPRRPGSTVAGAGLPLQLVICVSLF